MPDIIDISKIKRKNLLKIELDNGTSHTILNDTLVEFSLYPKMEISPEKLTEIIRYDQIRQVRDQAVKYLARRIHSKKELSDKLIQKGFSKKIIHLVIEELQEKKYINDGEFLHSFIQDRVNFSKKGRNIIIQELLLKGFARNEIDRVLSNYLDPEEELRSAEHLAESKWNFYRKKPLRERIQKTKQFLLQKGYPPEIVNQALERTVTEPDDG